MTVTIKIGPKTAVVIPIDVQKKGADAIVKHAAKETGRSEAAIRKALAPPKAEPADEPQEG